MRPFHPFVPITLLFPDSPSLSPLFRRFISLLLLASGCGTVRAQRPTDPNRFIRFLEAMKRDRGGHTQASRRVIVYDERPDDSHDRREAARG